MCSFLIELLSREDIFVILLKCAHADSIAEFLDLLYQVSNGVRNIVLKPDYLSYTKWYLNLKAQVVPGQVIHQYNHQFRRHLCLNMDDMYHLMWSVKDRDIETFRNILDVWKPKELSVDLELYKLVFELGCNSTASNSIEEVMLNSIKNIVPGDDYEEISVFTIYCAGVAYSRKKLDITEHSHSELYVHGASSDNSLGINLDTFATNDVYLILFEAVRGNNIPLVLETKEKINSETFNHIETLGTVARDDVEALKDKDLKLYSPVIIPNLSSNLNAFGYKFFTQCFFFALYYNSRKVLNEYEKVFMNTDRSTIVRAYFPYTLDNYRWLDERLHFTDEDKKG